MVDYFPVLDRAVSALNPNTREARRVLYDRARRALIDGLRASDPTLSDTDLKTQSAALETAIRRALKADLDAANMHLPITNRMVVANAEQFSHIHARRLPQSDLPTRADGDKPPAPADV